MYLYTFWHSLPFPLDSIRESSAFMSFYWSKGKVREGVSERWGGSALSVDTCRSSKEHRHLNDVGECEVCMHLFSLRKSNVPLKNDCYQLIVRKRPTVRN